MDLVFFWEVWFWSGLFSYLQLRPQHKILTKLLDTIYGIDLGFIFFPKVSVEYLARFTLNLGNPNLTSLT